MFVDPQLPLMKQNLTSNGYRFMVHGVYTDKKIKDLYWRIKVDASLVHTCEDVDADDGEVR